MQSYELEALRGCESLLPHFTWVYCECSFLPLYEGQALADEVIAWLRERGFVLTGVYNMTYDGDGKVVQADFLFERKAVCAVQILRCAQDDKKRGARDDNGAASGMAVNKRSRVHPAIVKKPRFSISAKLRYMKATLTLTNRGVLTLPAKLRQTLGLKADDQLIAETVPEGLLLRPAVTLPVEIYTPEREREFDRAEEELAKVLAAKPAPKRRASRATRR